MNAKELIEQLSKLPPTMPVLAWNPVVEEYEPVTGVDVGDDGAEIFIQTDGE